MQIPPFSYNCYFNPLEKRLHFLKTSTVPWHIQVGCFYDICFRLADTVPPVAIRRMSVHAEEIRNTPLTDSGILQDERFLERLRIWEERGIGKCLLKDMNVKHILSEEILMHDEIECQVAAFVIMSNHVHLILKMLGVYSPYDLVTRIKTFSALRINKYLGRKGRLWMQGEYNHIIRSEEDLAARLKYLQENPGKMEIPVYIRTDDRLFLPYTTPEEEKAPLEQIDYYNNVRW